MLKQTVAVNRVTLNRRFGNDHSRVPQRMLLYHSRARRMRRLERNPRLRGDGTA